MTQAKLLFAAALAYVFVSIPSAQVLRAEEAPEGGGAPAAEEASVAPVEMNPPFALQYHLGEGSTLVYKYSASGKTDTNLTGAAIETRSVTNEIEFDVTFRLRVDFTLGAESGNPLHDVFTQIERVERTTRFDDDVSQVLFAYENGEAKYERRFSGILYGDDERDMNEASIRRVFTRPIHDLKMDSRGGIQNLSRVAPPFHNDFSSQFRTTFEQLFGGLDLQDLASLCLPKLPEQPVNFGDTWSETVDFLLVDEDIQRIDGYLVKFTYKLESYDAGTHLAKISYKGEIVTDEAYRPEPEGADEHEGHDHAPTLTEDRRENGSSYPSIPADAQRTPPTWTGTAEIDLVRKLLVTNEIVLASRSVEEYGGVRSTSDHRISYKFTLEDLVEGLPTLEGENTRVINVQHIFIGYGEGIRTRESASALATSTRAELNLEGTTFTSLLQSRGEDRRDALVKGLSIELKNSRSHEEFSRPYLDAAFALDVNGTSPVVEAEGKGFYIIHRVQREVVVQRIFVTIGGASGRTREDAFKKAQEFLTRLDNEDDFEAIMVTSGDDSRLKQLGAAYVVTDRDLAQAVTLRGGGGVSFAGEAEFVDASLALIIGENAGRSQIVETAQGYSIIRRIE
ncbi:MAG: peptidyl-prolyl cis-trans isomerase [Planctomycetes bacterium]|nr:peptidyl-prolyl cis-trans isomerase [Planctomycetota bacterium]